MKSKWAEEKPPIFRQSPEEMQADMLANFDKSKLTPEIKKAIADLSEAMVGLREEIQSGPCRPGHPNWGKSKKRIRYEKRVMEKELKNAGKSSVE